MNVNPIATLLLCDVAGEVCSPQGFGQAQARAIDLDEADAGGDTVMLATPGETVAWF
jgi:hypothetical protein